jgi:hypothetical protein
MAVWIPSVCAAGGRPREMDALAMYAALTICSRPKPPAAASLAMPSTLIWLPAPTVQAFAGELPKKITNRHSATTSTGAMTNAMIADPLPTATRRPAA